MKLPNRNHLVIHDYKNNRYLEPLTAAEFFEVVIRSILFFALTGIGISIYVLMVA